MRRVVFFIVELFSWIGFAETVKVPGFPFGAIEVSSDAIVDAGRKVLSDGVEMLDVSVRLAVGGTRPEVRVRWSMPYVDIRQAWSLGFSVNHNSIVKGTSTLTAFAPVYAFKNAADENRWTFAADDAVSCVRFWSSIREESRVCNCGFDFARCCSRAVGGDVERICIRVDSRRTFWSDAVIDAVRWIRDMRGYEPLSAPKSAFAPLYSTWYAFHQRLDAKTLERECARAVEMGMGTLIADDGWQTADSSRGYEHCGDWLPCVKKFPDMKAHVSRIHALGMRYVLWYAVPFVGAKNPAFASLRAGFLRTVNNVGYGEVGILDPRIPVVRERLVGIFEDAVKDWDIDGLKLDFLGQYAMCEDDVQRGVSQLLDETIRRLRQHKSDLLIEFRQGYVGPAISRYGNMMRVSDCPIRPDCNRVGIAGLRIGCPDVAVHSDMLEWHHGEMRETVAMQIINSIFGVVQYSMVLSELPKSHLQVVRHWISFAREHEGALLHGIFRPHHPEFEYPLIEGEDEHERVVVTYVPNQVIDIASLQKRTLVVNGAQVGYVDVFAACSGNAVIFNTIGVRVSTVRVGLGVTRLPIPKAGYAIFESNASNLGGI